MTQARHPEEISVPKPALYAAGAMIAFALAAAIAGRAGYIERVAVEIAPPVETRLLSFETLADTSVAVTDVTSGLSAGTIEGGSAGFINGVLRGLNHHRRIAGIAPSAPYELIRTSAGRLAFVDPGTDRRVELVGFGADNDAAFGRLMNLGRGE